jgi:hypothetical protein
MIVGWVFDFGYSSALVETQSRHVPLRSCRRQKGLTGIENVD